MRAQFIPSAPSTAHDVTTYIVTFTWWLTMLSPPDGINEWSNQVQQPIYLLELAYLRGMRIYICVVDM